MAGSDGGWDDSATEASCCEIGLVQVVQRRYLWVLVDIITAFSIG